VRGEDLKGRYQLKGFYEEPIGVFALIDVKTLVKTFVKLFIEDPRAEDPRA
jgi:hypothetical protein